MEDKTLEKIKTIFRAAFTEKRELNPLSKYKEKARMVASNYMVYSFSALPLLIEKMKQLQTWEKITTNSARFVVEKDGNCWFALEGVPGDVIDYKDERRQPILEQIPAHSDMTPSKRCISSGIIVFSDEYKIEKISNFSGHYRPAPGTLAWILSSLLTLKADFHPTVELIFFWKKKFFLEHKKISLPKDDLKTLLSEGCVTSPNTDHSVGVFSNEEWQYYTEGEVPEFKHPERKSKRSHKEISSENRLSIFSNIAEAVSYESPVTAPASPDASLKTVFFSDDEQDEKSSTNQRTMLSLTSIFAESKTETEEPTESTYAPLSKKIRY